MDLEQRVALLEATLIRLMLAELNERSGVPSDGDVRPDFMTELQSCFRTLRDSMSKNAQARAEPSG